MVLHTPVTSAPKALAICTAKDAHTSRRADDQHLLPRLHVRLADGLQRGDARDRGGRRLLEGEVHRLGGEHLRLDRRVLSKRAVAGAIDLIPGTNSVTFLPTDSTDPASARPGLDALGERTPKPTRRIAYGIPVMQCHVPMSTLAAATRTRTSSSPIVGLAILRVGARPRAPCRRRLGRSRSWSARWSRALALACS